MIKMLSFDLDGTLLRDDKTISKTTLRAIELRRQMGIKAIIATARGTSSKKLAPPELFDGRVLNNGAVAYSNGNIIYDKTLPPAVALPIMRKLDKEGIVVSANVDGMHFVNSDAVSRWDNTIRYTLSDFSYLPGNTGKLSAVVERPEQVEIIRNVIPEGLYLSVSKDGLAMIMDAGATKSGAVFAIGAAYGIAPNEIAAFGDDANDIDLLSLCGFGVAMENALDEVKNAARYMCGGNNDDGIAKWLDEYLPV